MQTGGCADASLRRLARAHQLKEYPSCRRDFSARESRTQIAAPGNRDASVAGPARREKIDRAAQQDGRRRVRRANPVPPPLVFGVHVGASVGRFFKSQTIHRYGNANQPNVRGTDVLEVENVHAPERCNDQRGNFKANPPMLDARESSLDSIIDVFFVLRHKIRSGEGEIRTLGTRKGSAVFKTAAFNRSATSPPACFGPREGRPFRRG